MNKIVMVNATSLASGGGLTILNQYIARLSLNADRTSRYYLFVPDSCNSVNIPSNVMIVKNSANPHYTSRDYWNLLGMQNWCRANKLWPDELFSMQNYFPFGFKSGVKFKSVYVHQHLPFFDYQWGVFNKDERMLWFYRNIYFHLIKKSVAEADKVIVQTEWMRGSVAERCRVSHEKIVVERPDIGTIDLGELGGVSGLKGEVKLFYPASGVVYKNHQVLYRAMELVVNKFGKKGIVLYLTLDPDNPKAWSCIKGFKLEENVVLTGKLSYQQVMNYYQSVDALVFPSKVETFGLPLLEAQSFSLHIIANNLGMYREVIGQYKGSVTYCDGDDAASWAKAICSLIRPKK